MPAPLYARYVPPKSAKVSIPKSLSLPKPETAPATEPKPAADNSKKRRRTIDQDHSEADLLKTLHSKDDEIVTEAPKPKKEKVKKRKRDTVTEQTANGNNEVVLKKHKSVLAKFEKSSKVAEAIRNDPEAALKNELKVEVAPEELHDLIPLPQPEPVPEAPYQPTFSDLPSWLAEPIMVPSDKHTPFRDLGIDAGFVEKLAKKGHNNALAVQSQLVPMLRPGLEQHLGDLCVLAKTGSGKTLAYLLPMIESMKNRTVTKLSVVVVVPTRMLVNQVRAVADELCAGTRLKVGTAIGDVPLPTERKTLVKLSGRYNPERAKELHEKANEQLRTGFVERGGTLDDLMSMLPGHIPHYESKIDVLICTPGRLVEHIQSTTGFLLRDVQWVVFDEADQLLDQNFQDWANVLMDSLHGDTPEDFMDARESLCKKKGWLSPKTPTKVVLSATMTNDLTKLAALRLLRPKLVAVQDETPGQQTTEVSFELPSTLEEFAMPVGDGSDKPLYLLYLLQTKLLSSGRGGSETESKRRDVSDSDSETDSDSDASSSESEEDEDEDVESSTSGSDSESDSSLDDSDDDSHAESRELQKLPNQSNAKQTSEDKLTNKRVLIFTKSNENAARLSHLLSSMYPPLKSKVGALTKAASSDKSKRLLKAFCDGKIQILIASDRASRGLDIPDLAHVVNYDIPHQITSYVHRVGRTARAEKQGQAWTLFTNSEARWFWNEIARGNAIKRGSRKVERVKPDSKAVSDERREAYEAALEELQEAVEGDYNRPKKG
ncbi:P-loop containing nucleoside triphosphate hydrolase protein [Delitschia confertaspora ATCC 74209]|uniref:ATP-dependent RNA helicase n=1 Tax=Delitschia confertaspora ATCC 74209 TaxID=1513339 RepID=A0A9P4JSH0_9PLEO|nr:P-loop containing nucleoside triphosphate hydrolase protein [Delitschia confertaspora ATCC 74209]